MDRQDLGMVADEPRALWSLGTLQWQQETDRGCPSEHPPPLRDLA